MYEVWGQRDDGTVVKVGAWVELAQAQADLAAWKARGFFRRLWIQ